MSLVRHSDNMRLPFRYIAIALASFVTVLSLNSCGKDGVIEEEDMSQIYAEMLITDQWINTTPGVRMIADTSLVYEPILKKYGYTSEDYRRSVEYYLNDPEVYAEIMNETVKILGRRLADLNRRKLAMEAEKDRVNFVKGMSRQVKLPQSWLSIRLADENMVRCDDSLAVEWDSLWFCFNMSRVQRKAVADTLTVSDTLTVCDTLAVTDSLPAVDSLAGFKKPVTLKGTLFNVPDTLLRKRKK